MFTLQCHHAVMPDTDVADDAIVFEGASNGNVTPAAPPVEADSLREEDQAPLPPDRFLDRETSWLAFNRRVLELAEDPTTPLLERARFLAIVASNLDEFFMVRVAGLKRRIVAGVASRASSGMLPREVLEHIWSTSRELMERHAACFHDDVAPALAAEGIAILRWEDLTDDQRKEAGTLFADRVFPVLTPLAVDPAHPFPYISGLSLNLAVVVRNPGTGHEHFARVKVPPSLPRFVAVGSDKFVPLEDVIAEHLDLLFPGMEVLGHHIFRVTRNEDFEVEEDDAENLLQALERELLRRRFGPPVRLEVEHTMDPHVLDLLVRELGVSDLRGVLADRSARPDRPARHRRPRPGRPQVPRSPPGDPPRPRRGREREGARHLHRRPPRRRAAAPPVRLVLDQRAGVHRAGRRRPAACSRSSRRSIGPAVTRRSSTRWSTPPRPASRCSCIVELKARFDEHANIRWARALEQAGCHVVYGLIGLKTHCKLAMVVRDEPDGLRRYVHIGTGNYNPKTARAATRTSACSRRTR